MIIYFGVVLAFLNNGVPANMPANPTLGDLAEIGKKNANENIAGAKNRVFNK